MSGPIYRLSVHPNSCLPPIREAGKPEEEAGRKEAGSIHPKFMLAVIKRSRKHPPKVYASRHPKHPLFAIQPSHAHSPRIGGCFLSSFFLSSLPFFLDAFLDEHHQRRDANGRCLLVRNGYLPPREVVTGAGPLEIRQPQARDKSESAAERVEFLPKIIPAYLRRSRSVEEFIHWLYLKGISTNDFSEALAALLGKEVAGQSPNVNVRPKETWCAEFEEWNRRDLSDRRYVYVWADGNHVNVRLEDGENRRLCLLMLMGATADDHKESRKHLPNKGKRRKPEASTRGVCMRNPQPPSLATQPNHPCSLRLGGCFLSWP